MIFQTMPMIFNSPVERARSGRDGGGFGECEPPAFWGAHACSVLVAAFCGDELFEDGIVSLMHL
jgi:hypothetical protein